MDNSAHNNLYPVNPELLEDAKTTVVIGLMDANHAWSGFSAQEGNEEVGDVHAIDSDRATKADIACEVALLEQAKDTGRLLRWASEEHPQVTHVGQGFYNPETGDGAEATVIVDGIDGTSNAKADWANGRYGGMAAVARGGSPRYGDSMVAGIGMFPQGQLLFASASEGAFMLDLTSDDPELQQVRTSSVTELTADAAGYAEQLAAGKVVDASEPLYNFYSHVTEDARTLQATGLKAPSSGSTAANAFDVATGKALFDVSASRKGNLEQITIYRIIKEAGGVMYAAERDEASGKLRYVSLEDKDFFTYAQTEPVTLVTAANDAIANQLLAILNGELTQLPESKPQPVA